MRPSSYVPLFTCLLAVATLSGAASARAQQFTLDRFYASETPDDAFHVSRPDALGHLKLGAQLHIDYAHDPLVFERDLGDSDSEIASVVSHQLVGTVGFALGIDTRGVIFAGLPFSMALVGDSDTFGVTEAHGAGLGDAYLGGRLRLVGEQQDLIGLALQATATFPTGTGDYGGDDFLTFHPEVLFEIRPAFFRLTLNAGWRIREDERLAGNVLVGDELTYALGVTVPVIGTHYDERATRLDLHAQVYGTTATSDFFDRESTPVEVIGGIKLHHDSGFVVGAAGGAGVTRGVGSPDARAIVTIGWRAPADPLVEEVAEVDSDGDGLLDSVDRCPTEPEDMDGFEDSDGCPDADNDSDGVLDVDDRCPLEPGIADNDGCPDPDTDGDGILDSVDQCDDQAEDVDEFEDEDGCPDPDNDDDGVLDTADGCPMEAGPVANNGCPDADRDGDGIVDRLDNCPDEAGTESNHGCRERQQVIIREDRLEILDKVFFATNRARIRSKSHRLLRNVAAVLNNHPEITLVRIEGHTDSQGADDYNMELSQKRAEAVRDFLVEEGVTTGRLVARGFGETRPIEDNGSRDGRAANRRVEFNLGEENPNATVPVGAQGASDDGTDDLE